MPESQQHWWRDPVLPDLNTFDDDQMRLRHFRLGDATFQLLPKQYEFIFAPERFTSLMGAFGSGKTRPFCYKAAFTSMIPNNRGVVGRFASTDLRDTTERDLCEFLEEAKLLKRAPRINDRTAEVYCVDLDTNRPLGATSEISFQHMDDPDHLRGRHLGWFGIDEGSEVAERAFTNLVGRVRLPHIANKGLLKGFVTGNPEGHNWIYDFWFNEEKITSLPMDHRLLRRGISSNTYENWFLPPDYLESMEAVFSEEWKQRYLMGSFDVFEGQIFKEFDNKRHIVSESVFSETGGVPPFNWIRLLGIDVGGASPWAFLWCAVDNQGNVIVYDEIYKTTTDVDLLTDMALPKMNPPGGGDYQFQAAVIDYENKIAAEDLSKRGINCTNAQKRNKQSSILRLASYLHPQPDHRYPEWHSRAGERNAPRLFISDRCVNLRRELPQQRWKEQKSKTGDLMVKDEMAANIPNHAVDALLYILRERPQVSELPKTLYDNQMYCSLSKSTQMYYHDAAKHALETSGKKTRWQRGSALQSWRKRRVS
jgi:hypothetical protein